MAQLTTAQYAASIGVSQRTVQRWVKDGDLLAEKVGRKYLIDDQTQPQPLQPEDQQIDESSGNVRTEFLTTKEYAQLLNVSQRTIQRWISEGRVRAVRDGRRYLIERAISPEADPQSYAPENPENEDTEGFPITDETQFPAEALRKEFSTLEEVVNYATPIPVPTKIIKNARNFFRVVVLYDIVSTAEEDEKPEEEQ